MLNPKSVHEVVLAEMRPAPSASRASRAPASKTEKTALRRCRGAKSSPREQIVDAAFKTGQSGTPAEEKECAQKDNVSGDDFVNGGRFELVAIDLDGPPPAARRRRAQLRPMEAELTQIELDDIERMALMQARALLEDRVQAVLAGKGTVTGDSDMTKVAEAVGAKELQRTSVSLRNKNKKAAQSFSLAEMDDSLVRPCAVSNRVQCFAQSRVHGYDQQTESFQLPGVLGSYNATSLRTCRASPSASTTRAR